MEEKLYFWENLNGKKVFIHEYIPVKCRHSKCIIFLNPLFDEMHSIQIFHSETARQLSKNGYYVVRFDYMSSGDSEGATFDFSFKQCVTDTVELCSHFNHKYADLELLLLGCRMGATISTLVAAQIPFIHELILIEPIIAGNRYLYEQKIRRQMFYKLNRITTPNYNAIINQTEYEDLQGYPLNKETLSFLEKLDLREIDIQGKIILLFKLKYVISKKNIEELEYWLSKKNKIHKGYCNISDFWSTNQRTITTDLTNLICTTLNHAID